MIRCKECKSSKIRRIFDEYDNDTYKVCGICGGKTEQSEAVCASCRKPLFSGDTAYETENHLFCKECVTEVTV